MEPGGMAMASFSSMDDAARTEQFQEHQLRLQEKYRLQHQHQMELAHTGTHPHDIDVSQPYVTSQGLVIYPQANPFYLAKSLYALSDFELLETL
ncbi:hypothetical protein BGZ46_005875, partial [Entomortierella lignicola]